jgi:hypothetical protein
MGIGRLDPDELPGAIARMVRWRWPGERLLATVPCEAEWIRATEPWGAPEDEDVVEPGVLGVTDRRVVYRTLDRADLAFSISAWAFSALAVVGFLAREGTMTPYAAVLAPAMWAVSRAVAVFGIGAGTIELSGIEGIDHAGRRIFGVDRWGVHYRIRLSEPDLRRVAPLLAG